ncbi:MAG: alcohol dehydrogenase catalytic domain-containing protein [Deltaproteobacteria bacterium]|nr:alcohol dehydrogenase catalytic domain-containing protein [Deltaproteobacteria bacterium]
MLALVMNDAPCLATDHPNPKRARGEALVRVLRAGICDTDLQLARGYMGFRGVLGHELVGLVVEADDVGWIGKRVVSDINAGCGDCPDCRDGNSHHCPTRSVLGILNRDGCIAEWFVIPEGCLVEVPASLDDDKAVFAEPLAAALHVLDSIPPGADHAVVLGDGKLGLLTALALQSSGVRVTLIGHHARKLAIATAAGVEVSLSSEGLGRAAVVVEATGSRQGLCEALHLTKPQGTLVLKTTVADPLLVDLSPAVVDEIRIVGSRCGDLARALHALANGAVDPLPLVDARFPIEQAHQALARAAEKGILKVLVDFPQR